MSCASFCKIFWGVVINTFSFFSFFDRLCYEVRQKVLKGGYEQSLEVQTDADYPQISASTFAKNADSDI